MEDVSRMFRATISTMQSEWDQREAQYREAILGLRSRIQDGEREKSASADAIQRLEDQLKAANSRATALDAEVQLWKTRAGLMNQLSHRYVAVLLGEDSSFLSALSSLKGAYCEAATSHCNAVEQLASVADGLDRFREESEALCHTLRETEAARTATILTSVSGDILECVGTPGRLAVRPGLSLHGSTSILSSGEEPSASCLETEVKTGASPSINVPAESLSSTYDWTQSAFRSYIQCSMDELLDDWACGCCAQLDAAIRCRLTKVAEDILRTPAASRAVVANLWGSTVVQPLAALYNHVMVAATAISSIQPESLGVRPEDLLNEASGDLGLFNKEEQSSHSQTLSKPPQTLCVSSVADSEPTGPVPPSVPAAGTSPTSTAPLNQPSPQNLSLTSLQMVESIDPEASDPDGISPTQAVAPAAAPFVLDPEPASRSREQASSIPEKKSTSKPSAAEVTILLNGRVLSMGFGELPPRRTSTPPPSAAAVSGSPPDSIEGADDVSYQSD